MTTQDPNANANEDMELYIAGFPTKAYFAFIETDLWICTGSRWLGLRGPRRLVVYESLRHRTFLKFKINERPESLDMVDEPVEE